MNVVEIDAGDTYAYDEGAKTTQRAREEAAADRIFNILPKDQAEYMRELWEEFEERKTPEAQFARTLDNTQPVMLNDATDGLAWREHEVKLSQVMGRNKDTHKGSEDIWKYMEQLFKDNVSKGNLIED